MFIIKKEQLILFYILRRELGGYNKLKFYFILFYFILFYFWFMKHKNDNCFGILINSKYIKNNMFNSH